MMESIVFMRFDLKTTQRTAQLARTVCPHASSAFIPATAEPGGPPPLTHLLLSTMLPPAI
jgi:hypothetical protein